MFMKNFILLIAFIGTFSSLAFAQEPEKDLEAEKKNDWREEVLFGAKIGGNSSTIYNREEENFHGSSIQGFAGGIFVAIPINKYYGFQPELMFSQRGFHAEGSLNAIPFSVTRKTNYIDVPLLFAVKPGKYFTILAGPQYSALVSHKDTYESPGVGQEAQFDNDDIRRNLICFTGGLDLALNHFVLSARAGWDITRSYEKIANGSLRYRNMWSQATIGYRF
jgi:hypothetical protein